MKNSTLLFVFLLLLGGHSAMAQISGTVFKDFNFNGTQQTSGFPIEPGVYAVQVKAFNAAGAQLGTTKLTDNTGAFSFSIGEIPATTAVRIEFSSPSGAFDSKVGAANRSNVQFIVAPSITANYAITSRLWYSSTANPYMVTSAGTNGDPNGGGTAGTNNNLYIFPYDMSNDGGTSRRLVNSQLGSVYGLAYQKATRTIFMSAYLKRHAGFGPNGIGAIYKSVFASGTDVPGTASLLVNVSTIGINVGTDPRTVVLPAASNTRNTDVGVFAEIGKRGIGGISLSEDGTNLYLVNMFEKKLHRINIGAPVKTSFTAADVTGNWVIPDPSTAGMTWHPMACKVAQGKVYVGGVVVFEKTTAHVLATDSVGARGIVYEFDPATQVFTEVLRFPFNYRRGFSNSDVRFPTRCNWWCAWQNNGNGGAADPLQTGYNNVGGTIAFNGGIYYPQPMLSDLEFDVNGEMILGIRDRFGDQMGYQNAADDNMPAGGFGSGNYFRALSSGEVLRAGRNVPGGVYTMESLGGINHDGGTQATSGLASGNPTTAGSSWTSNTLTPYGGDYGPGWGGTAGTIPAGGPNPGTQGAYYYFNHNFTTTGTPGSLNGTGAINSHYCKSDGTLALLPGSNEVVHTLMDPINTAYTQGLSKMFNSGASAGNMSQRIQLTITAAGDPSNMGKAGGLGDIELLTDYEPIEIGNRVWNDANNDGVQTAGELPLAGITVELVGPGPDNILGTNDDAVVASTTTSATGEYYFNTLTTADSRKPVAFIGVGANDILPGFSYQVRINPIQAALVGYQMTKSNPAANSMDNIDNDATLINGYAAVSFTAGNTDHNFDFGFKTSASLGDRVWLDTGLGGGTANNGVQDGTEPGVAGITVTLYNSLGAPVATTITDAYGNYLFDNLTIGTYTVGFTLPANYSFTTQTNTTDDNNTTGASTTGSDVNVTTGRTYTIALTAGENNRNIDAGLIFTPSAVTQSLGNTVWLDTDLNGLQNGTEAGVASITVTLYNGTTAVATTITDANGKYLFSNIPTGTYTVGFTLPSGMRFTTQGGTVSTDLNSDANVNTGRTNAITVNSGDNIVYVDAGIYPVATTKASLGDKVFNDLDHDGVQDAGEPGIGGVTVNLYINGNPVPVATTVTDPYGNYMFTNLDAGNYQVEFIKPAGYTGSPQKVATGGGNSATDSDPNPVSGRTGSINLKEGDRNTSVDAGMYITTPAGNLKLGDYVWNDLDRDGIQDANEAGIAGITVTLYRNGPDGLAGTADDIVIATTFTDANGNYLFTDLAASVGATTNYNVGFSNLPAGYSFTTLNQTAGGGTASNDNNANNLGRTAAINLTADNLTIDAGIFQGTPAGKGTLGDRVWYDLNGNGVQDAGELGVAGVTVTLQKDLNNDGDFNDAGEATFATTTTDALGGYLFTGLDAGTYRVQFTTMPVGMVISPRDTVTGTDQTDSDGDNAGTTIASAATASTTGSYTLATGEDNLTVDLGLVPAASRNTLGDYVWYDVNNNGIQDAIEPGVAGVTITLYNNTGTAIASTTTDINGNYLFANLADGTYTVGFSNFPAGFELTTQSSSNDLTGSDADRLSARTGSVTLTYASGGTARDNRSLDAGIISTRAALGNYVWLDDNGDGIQDATEKGVSGVTVILYAADGTTVLASTITDANGRYLFPNLIAGTYVVGFSTIPAGLQFTQQNTPGDNQLNTNSDASPSTGKTSVITLTAAETDLTIDAGLRSARTATVGDYVWSDLDGDGVQGANEPGIGGIVVTMYDVANNPIGTAITDPTGKYLFTNVTPGNGYYIIFSNTPNNPAGSVIQPSFTTQGLDAGTNTSHANAAGRTHAFNVAYGDNIRNIDAGIKDYPGRAILPIQSLELSATLHGTTATIAWITDNELNTAKFIVERSTDNTNFTAAGERAGAGTYAGKSYYTLDDNIASFSNVNVIYYRIKALDANGRFTYSKVVAVRISNIVEVRTWPSPFTSQVFVAMFSSSAQQLQVQLTDFSGKMVKRAQFNVPKGNNQLVLTDLANLAAATYIIKITAANGEVISTQTLLKN